MCDDEVLKLGEPLLKYNMAVGRLHVTLIRYLKKVFCLLSLTDISDNQNKGGGGGFL